MPLVTAIPRGQGNGQVLREFIDSIGTTTVTYNYPVTQEWLRVRNTGTKAITVTVAGNNQTIQPGQQWEVKTDFSSFDISSTGEVQSFEAVADEKGLAFNSPEGAILNKRNGAGTSSQRTTAPSIGDSFFDTTLLRRIDWNGNRWQKSDGTPADTVTITDANVYPTSAFYSPQTFIGGNQLTEQLSVNMAKDWIHYFKFKLADADDYMNVTFKEAGVLKLQFGFGFDWVAGVKNGISISVNDVVNAEKTKLYDGNFYSADSEIIIWYDKKWGYFNFYVNNTLVASWKPAANGVNPLNQTRIGILVGSTATSATFQYHYMASPLVSAIGDSITGGAILHAPNPDYYAGVDTYQGYPKQFSSWLQGKGIKNYFVVNKGVNGETTQQMLDRFSADIVGMTPKYVFIHGGINDHATTGNAQLAYNNKKSMMDTAKANNITPIVLSVIPTKLVAPGASHQFSIELNVVEKNNGYSGSMFINLWGAIEDPNSLNVANSSLIADTVHPNATGYQAISDMIGTYLNV